MLPEEIIRDKKESREMMLKVKCLQVTSLCEMVILSCQRQRRYDCFLHWISPHASVVSGV